MQQAEKADSIEIATGYVTEASLEELDDMIDRYKLAHVSLIIGMYYIEGMPESSYHIAMELNRKWKASGKGEIRIVYPFKYHGKLYNFIKNEKCFASIVGSANMGVIKPDASNRRQYEVSVLIEEPSECLDCASFTAKLNSESVSKNIEEIEGMKLIRGHNVYLDGIDTVVRISSDEVKLYNQYKTDTCFVLPIKAPAYHERFMDDKKHFTKSNINVCYAAPRSKRKSRDWYEVQMTVSKKITQCPGYPKKNAPFFVVTDDGYRFKAHVTSDSNKQFSAVGDELIMGRWIKGRLAAAKLVTPVNNSQEDTTREGMITQEMLEAYGCDAVILTKTRRKFEDEEGNWLDVWTLCLELTNN